MSHAFAQSIVTPQQPGTPDYDALVEIATAPLREAFGETVTLEVERLDRIGRWAFLMGTLRAPGGERPTYAGTEYAQRAASGGMSDLYVALLRAGPDVPETSAVDAPPSAEAGDTSGGVSAPASDGDQGHLEWTVLEHAIGPSDVAWLTWPERHAAPRHLFGF